MRTLRITAAVAVAALAPAAGASAGVHIASVDAGSYPELRVTVVAPAGSRAPRLTENGVPVAGAQVVNLGRSKSVALAVDRSQSMAGASLADAAAAARAFVTAMAAGDRVEVLAFGRQSLALTRFSSSTADAGAALHRLAPDAESGTALWDAVVAAARGLSREDDPGHVIIVVTDGRDVSSSATFQDAVAAARRAHAAVYTIGIAAPDFTPAPLRRLAELTGGAYHEVVSTSGLAVLYSQIARSLAGTWQIRYPTAARPGDTLHLAASVVGEGEGVRTLTLSSADGVSATPTPAPPAVLPRSAWRSRVAPAVVVAAVGLLALLAAGFFGVSRRGLWLDARLAPHLGAEQRRAKARRRRRGSSLRSVFAATEQAFGSVKRFQALQSLLARADLPLLAAEVLYICLGSAIVLGLLAGVVGAPPLLVLGFMALGAAIPIIFVRFKATARIKAFDNQLPDLLITIAASLKAGHSFRHAIQAVVDESGEPAAKEFRRVLAETRLGRSMDEALADMAKRIGSKNLSFVLTAVTIQRQIGGSLADLFDMVAETVRQRHQFTRKIRGLTAMGRMSAYVLAGLPFFIALAVTVMNPAYMSPLWNTGTGHELIAIGFAMLTVGGLILKKIVSFKG